VSSVASIPSPALIYREDQLFHCGLYFVPAVTVLVAAAALANRLDSSWVRDLMGLAGLGLGSGLGLALRMTTIVDPLTIQVSYGWIPLLRRNFDPRRLRAVEVVAFRPWRDHGGWGPLRGHRGERVYSARGCRGVRLTFVDGSQVILGSQQPEKLARCLNDLISS
jgi:hypothetical protein